MEKTNHFSARFAKKSTQELKEIANNRDYSDDAQLAAMWELEKRNEHDAEQVSRASRIATRQAEIRERRHEYKKYQTFFPRFIAAIIDGLIVSILSFVASSIVTTISPNSFASSWFDVLLEGLFVYGYFVFMHGNMGQTIGKLAMNVKVVNYTDESGIDYKQALIRDSVPIAIILLTTVVNIISSTGLFDFSSIAILLFYLGSVSTFWTLAEIITMLFNDKSRALHDFIAKTVVIRLR